MRSSLGEHRQMFTLHKEAQNNAASHSGGNLAGDVGAHGVHQQVVLVVLAMPIFSTIRADMGNAEIPAAPTMGLILVRLKILRILANTTPAMVSKIKATSPGP